MEILIPVLLYGTSYAFILFLLSSGLSLIFGVMGILNLAHGAIYILGAYLGISAEKFTGNFWLGAFFSGIGVAIVGLILERLFLKKLHNKFNEQALLTLGIVYICTNIILWIWGSIPRLGSPPVFLKGAVYVFGYILPSWEDVLKRHSSQRKSAAL